MLHGLPYQGYLNHGFYNYHPYFFKNIADANDYKMVGMWLHEWPSDKVKVYSDQLMSNLQNNVLTNVNVLLFVAFKKQSTAEFKIPLIGHMSILEIYKLKTTIHRRVFEPDKFHGYPLIVLC